MSGAAAGAAAGAGAGAAAAAAGAGAGAAGADFFLDSFFPFGISESTGGWETRGTVTWRVGVSKWGLTVVFLLVPLP